MSHELSVNKDGQIEMFYFGQKPWHGLGTELPELATSVQALQAAHLDWNVELRPCLTSVQNEGNDEIIEIADKKVVVRTDSNLVLGVVGSQYTPLQNVDAFDFFDAVVGEKLAIYETAGALFQGRRVWMLAKIPGEMLIQSVKEDAVEKYLLFMTAHDGTMSVRMLFSPVRVVCNNTLTIALSRGSSDGIAIRHTTNIQAKIDIARQALGFAVQQYAQLETTFNEMAMKRLEKDVYQEYLKTLIPDNEEAENHTRTQNMREEIEEKYHNEKNTLEGMQETVWAAYNSVVEYVDHGRTIRNTSGSYGENRMASLVYGSGAQLKQKALVEAKKLLVA